MAKNDEDESITSRTSSQLGRPQFGSGRLGTYTVLGAATGVVPLPFVPDIIVKRVRGALLHDLTARHGLSLTPEARKVLIEGADGPPPRNYLRQGAVFAASRVLGRLGPLALVGPVRTALGTFVLGYLVERYLETARTIRSVRIDADEARRVRRAIDKRSSSLSRPRAEDAREDRPFAAEDLRDPTTKVVDGVLISLASAPGWLVRRLEAAFDEIWSLTGDR